MRWVYLLAACVLLATVCTGEDTLDSAEDERTTLVVKHVVIVMPEGQSIVIGMVTRAPFPQLPSVPPTRLAVMGMLANCRDEAIHVCGASPESPICPGRLARCLISNEPLLSSTCRDSVETLARTVATENAESAPQPPKMAEFTSSPAGEDDQHSSFAHYLHCFLHHSSIMQIMALAAALLFLITAWDCIRRPDGEDDLQDRYSQLLSEPKPRVILAMPDVKLEASLVMESSENQV